MNVMLDLETMGSGPNAAIVAIGAVAFDATAGTLGDRFYRTVQLGSSVKAGGVIDPDTVMWWLGQGEAARMALIGDAAAPVIANRSGLTRRVAHLPAAEERAVLEHFAEWLPGECFMWGNGAAFDNVVLTSAYTRHGLKRPWSYRNDRCYRTVKALAPHVAFKEYGTVHHALDDAVAQAEHLMKIRCIYTHLGGGLT